MSDLKKLEQEHEANALRINAGRKPKFGDLMRNPWASDGNPQRDGYFVRERHQSGAFNPGHYYEFTDKRGKFWETRAKYAFFIDTQPEATAPASLTDALKEYSQRDLLMMHDLSRKLLWLAYVWNDHNFGAAHLEARRVAEAWGIKSFDDANRYLEKFTAPAQDLSAAILARQIIQDTNDTLREQSEGLRQLKAENDQLHALLASSANALSAGDGVDAVKTGTLYQAIQRAAGELPDDYTIRIEIEQGSAVVELAGADCEWVLVDGNDGYLCQAVNAATDRAILQSQKGGSHD